MTRVPTSAQLVIPLHDLLREAGQPVRPGEAYEALADRLGLDDEALAASGTEPGGRQFGVFRRNVRWARQQLVFLGLADRGARGEWRLLERRGDVIEQRPGVAVTLFRTTTGFMLWARIEDALAHIARNSVQLVYTSPPYAGIAREYGTRDSASWLSWMTDIATALGETLTADGSLMLNLGPKFRPGGFEDPYWHRLLLALDDRGLQFRQDLIWHKPNALACPAEHVAKRKTLFRPSVEHVLWFAPGDRPKAHIERVATPYRRAPRPDGRDRGTRRPSGQSSRSEDSFYQAGGRLPDDLFQCGVEHPHGPWRRRAKALGIPAHPAVFPEKLPERAIQVCTDPGDVVLDPFMGSGSTAAAAERLGRRWIGVDQSRRYGKLAALRFADAGLEWLGGPDDPTLELHAIGEGHGHRPAGSDSTSPA